MYSKRSIVSTSLLILLVALTSWFSIKNQKFQIPQLRPKMVSETIDNANVTKMNADGNMEYQAHAIHITKLHSGKTLLTQLTGKFYNTDQKIPPWRIQAQKGQLTNTNQKLTLWDHVVISRTANTYATPYRITTSVLYVYPKQHRAHTPAPVTIYQPGTPNVTTATGLNANMKTKTINLLSDVRSIYDTHATYTHG